MHKTLWLLVGALLLLGTAAFTYHTINSKTLSRPMDTHTAAADSSTFFSLTANSIDGETVSFEQYRGKKIIVLNTASACGYTPQYADWEKFYAENEDQVVVLGFPCNDFGGQEPGSEEDIKSFCQKNYGVTFPMFEKVAVKGADKSPVYQWLTDPAKNGWNSQEPSWNFCKYVLDENGTLTHFFASKIKPSSEEFLKAMGM
ncbi:MAG: glutathione peroxidase [Saprospiraceae bacterium]|nr:glutathione peroxidase [Saprospiraceae bacterium]